MASILVIKENVKLCSGSILLGVLACYKDRSWKMVKIESKIIFSSIPLPLFFTFRLLIALEVVNLLYVQLSLLGNKPITV